MRRVDYCHAPSNVWCSIEDCLMKMVIVFDEVPHEGHCPSAFIEVFRGSSVVLSEVDKGTCREREGEFSYEGERERETVRVRAGAAGVSLGPFLRLVLTTRHWEKVTCSHPSKQVGVSLGQEHLISDLLLDT